MRDGAWDEIGYEKEEDNRRAGDPEELAEPSCMPKMFTQTIPSPFLQLPEMGKGKEGGERGGECKDDEDTTHVGLFYRGSLLQSPLLYPDALYGGYPEMYGEYCL